MLDNLLNQYPFYLSTVLLAMGLWAMFAKRNLMKKLIGMTVFQVAIILLFISSSVKFGASTPAYDPTIGVADLPIYEPFAARADADSHCGYGGYYRGSSGHTVINIPPLSYPG